MTKTKFVTAALEVLAGPDGLRTCTDDKGRETTARAAWSVSQLELWEETEGESVTKIDTLLHWRSYAIDG
jgi:hypothetical protein